MSDLLAAGEALVIAVLAFAAQSLGQPNTAQFLLLLGILTVLAVKD